MGSTLSRELAGGELGQDLRSQITIQLRNNHYPPVPYEMVDPCMDAIVAYNDGDTDLMIDLPGGITYKGATAAPAWAIIENHHLGDWIYYDEE
jgi:hypothetical protein